MHGRLHAVYNLILEMAPTEEQGIERRSRSRRWSWSILACLHSRPGLITICILVLVDCLCVLGQMVVEQHAMRIRFSIEEDSVKSFENHLKTAVSNITIPEVNGVDDVISFLQTNMDVILSDRCSDFCVPNTNTKLPTNGNTGFNINGNIELLSDGNYELFQNSPIVSTTTELPCITSHHIWIEFENGDEQLFVIGEMDVNFKHIDEHESHGILKDIHVVTECLHILGLVIIAVMLVEVILRTVCRGRYFYRKKFEVFDAIIVIVAFTVDVVFISGIWSQDENDVTTILLLLLPWRFLRVVYSMVAAMNHKHHILVQQLKTGRRTSEDKLTKARGLILQMEKDTHSLASLCRRTGASEADISSCYGKTTTAAMSRFASTMLMISAPFLSESGVDNMMSPGYLIREVFEGTSHQQNEDENNNAMTTPVPAILRRTCRRAVNITPPFMHLSPSDDLGSVERSRVSIVEPCRRVYNSDDAPSVFPFVHVHARAETINPRTETTCL